METTQYLTIPTSPSPTLIPIGVSAEDYALILDTLRLWHHRICPEEAERRADAELKRVFTVEPL